MGNRVNVTSSYLLAFRSGYYTKKLYSAFKEGNCGIQRNYDIIPRDTYIGAFTPTEYAMMKSPLFDLHLEYNKMAKPEFCDGHLT
jgi:hypothetical protein